MRVRVRARVRARAKARVRVTAARRSADTGAKAARVPTTMAVAAASALA